MRDSLEASRRLASLVEATPNPNGFTLMNHSACPVYDLTVSAHVPDRPTAVFYEGFRPRSVRVLAPGGPNHLISGSWQLHHRDESGDVVAVSLPEFPGVGAIDFTITFLDAAGVRWSRRLLEPAELVPVCGSARRWSWRAGAATVDSE